MTNWCVAIPSAAIGVATRRAAFDVACDFVHTSTGQTTGYTMPTNLRLGFRVVGHSVAAHAAFMAGHVLGSSFLLGL